MPATPPSASPAEVVSPAVRNPEGDAPGTPPEGFRDSAVEFTRDAHLVTDVSGVILEADDSAAALAGIPRQFLIGKPLGLIVAEDYRRSFYDRLPIFTEADGATLLETRLARPRADARDVLVLRTPVADGAGRLAGFRWLLRDVSAARRVERTLWAERQLLDSVVEAAEAIVLVVDRDSHVLRANSYTHAASGYDPDALLGQRWCDVLLPPGSRDPAYRLMWRARTAGRAMTGVLPLRSTDGRVREMTWSARALPPGVAGAFVVFGYDVTELQQAQRQTMRAARLAAIGQMVGGLAHESRNALQRIQACLSMLALRVKGQPDALDLIDRAQKAEDDLERLFDGVRFYAGALHLERSACDLAAVWREAWADLVGLPDRDGAELHEEGTDADRTCVLDPFQMKRVFRNLFENARAATAGPVRVVVRCHAGSDGGRPALVVSVRDNGPGFPAGQRHRLFEPFFTTKTRGTGLGLAICRRIVEAHGGRIEAGDDGPGAEVQITLPRRTS